MKGLRQRLVRASAHRLAEEACTQFQPELGGIELDTGQQAAVAALSKPARHGYYLWGDVGRGKSLIADAYFAAIPTPFKRRFHFHEFFRDLHAEIRRERVPFAASIDRLLGRTRAVLFDEFHVHDVADGVYLAATLRALIARDVLLLTTSNYAPDDLMPNPYFHEAFQPTIAFIKANLSVVEIARGEDYRNRAVGSPGRGFASGTWRNRTLRPQAGAIALVQTLSAAGQLLQPLAINGKEAAFTFQELCERPLGTEQYLWIAERFTTLNVTEVPDPSTLDREPLLRFTNLIDVLYDRDLQVNVFAAGDPSQILGARHAPRDVARTVSRLSSLVVG